MTAGYEPTVSVIVPTYNAAATIDECVRSLFELRYPSPKLEVVVVDNGSRDGTAAAVSRYGQRILLLLERKRGAAAARNAGLARARGEVVAFTDADSTVHPEWLRHIVTPLQDPGVGIAGGSILAGPGANEIERFGERIHDHRRAIEEQRPPYAVTGNWASRRDLLCDLGGFDERFRRGQDVDLSFRTIQAGYRLAFVAEALVYHRNESTLAGLFREGFVHGFHGVHARRRHKAFLRQYGHGRGGRPHYSDIAARLLDWARGRDAARSRCDAVFNSGKKAGRLFGSLRFGYLDL
jgi:glycosyltransferase involved in cell wall biosynthesis